MVRVRVGSLVRFRPAFTPSGVEADGYDDLANCVARVERISGTDILVSMPHCGEVFAPIGRVVEVLVF